MAGMHLRNRSISIVEDSTCDKDSNDVDESSIIENTAIIQEAATDRSVVVSECEGTVITETSVSMLARQMQELLNSAINNLREDIINITETRFQDIVTKLDSKLQAATENITAKIQQENEKLSEKLTQNLNNEIQKLSCEICNLRDDTENKFQEVTRTIVGINDGLNEKIDAHVVATRKVTDRISQELNANSGRLLDDMKCYKTDTENSLKEFRQEYSQFREQLNSGQATWQNKAGGEIEKMNDNVKLVEERVAKLIVDRVTEVQAASQNSIRQVNTELKKVQEQLATRQLTDAIPDQVLPVTNVSLGNNNQANAELANSASNYHMGNDSDNNCTTSVCGNATSQRSVNNTAGSAIVNVKSDVFESNLHLNELTLPQFYDSSKQRYHRPRMKCQPQRGRLEESSIKGL